MPVSESIAERILCMPLYAGLEKEDLSIICKIINQTLC
jgi:dTDP-4-amino-4,6-dideoxygalactose transaminase